MIPISTVVTNITALVAEGWTVSIRVDPLSHKYHVMTSDIHGNEFETTGYHLVDAIRKLYDITPEKDGNK